MTTNTPRHHRIDYIEFTVNDLARSKDFYQKVFGWEFTDYGPGYSGIKGNDGEMGGFEQADQASVGGPLVILYSEDLEASVEEVSEAGGKIVKPVFDFPGGRRFHFEDPDGIELAVWTEIKG